VHAIMRYQIKLSELDNHLALLRTVYAELAERRPDGLTWASYQLDQPNHFLEVVSGPDLPGPLPNLPAFQAYRAGLDDRCETPSQFTEVDQVGSYHAPTAH
jgi:hypothetical protein